MKHLAGVAWAREYNPCNIYPRLSLPVTEAHHITALVFTTSTTIVAAGLLRIGMDIPVLQSAHWVFFLQSQSCFTAITASPSGTAPELLEGWLVLFDYFFSHSRSLRWWIVRPGGWEIVWVNCLSDNN